MNLNDVHRGVRGNKKRKRLGRGIGSGHGKTSGHGHKGQASRPGWNSPPTFEGGQMPLVRRVPKRGFYNAFAPIVATVNVGALEGAFGDGADVNAQSLREAGLVRGRFDLLKVLGDGTLGKKLKVSAHQFSRSAQEKIQQAGGEAVVLPGPAPVVKQKKKKSQTP